MLLSYGQKWKHQGLRQVPIPKPNGKTRILKIPTILHPIIPGNVLNIANLVAIEPAHKAKFHAKSEVMDSDQEEAHMTLNICYLTI